MTDLREQLAALSLPELAKLNWRSRWLQTARQKQVIDFSVLQKNTVFAHPGRGWGKTLVLANWISWELCNDSGSFGHLICATHNDVRYVAFEGESGILRQVPEILIKAYNKTDAIIEFYNGSILRGFSAEEPERLRGPQCKYLGCDELAAWIRDRETLEQARFGHRLGTRSTCVITSTPKPKELIRELFADDSIIKIGGHMEENTANLAPSYIEQMNRLKETRLGRQELAGELLDAEELGIIKRSQWKLWPNDEPLPAFEIIVMSLDTALSEESVDVKKNRTDFTACTVWGGFRLEDKAGKKIPKIILLDAWQERLGFPELLTRVKEDKEKHYGEDAISPQIIPLFGGRRQFGQGKKADIILIEDKNSGISLRQMLRRDGIPVVPYNPGRADKFLRLNLTAPIFVGGFVYAVQSKIKPTEFRAWAEPVIAQFCSYSGERSIEHDDLLDSGTQALLWLQRNWLGVVMPSFEKAPPKYNTRPGQNPYAV